MADKSSETVESGSDERTASSQDPQSIPDSPGAIYFIDGKPKTGRKLPTWLNHFNAKDLKVLFKCWVALFVATTFIFISPIADNFGTATFFGAIAMVMLPPSGIVFITILGGTTLAVGVLLAWAWGVIVMKAAQAARPAHETNALLASLQRTAVSRANSTGQSASVIAREMIFEGYMLDSRITAVYFSLLCLFIYLIARLRVSNPKLTLLQVFATIITDIFLTIGPLLPSFSGAIPEVLIKPALTSVAISAACSILIFPESTSHVVLGTMSQIIAPMEGILDACRLDMTERSKKLDIAQLRLTKSHMLAGFKGLEASLGFLPLDLNVGRWNPEDIMTLKIPLRQLTLNMASLLNFLIGHGESVGRMEHYAEMSALVQAEHDTAGEEKGNRVQLEEIMRIARTMQDPRNKEMVGRTFSALHLSSAGLLKASAEALQAIIEGIKEVNSRRWIGRMSKEQCRELQRQHQTTLNILIEERKKFKLSNADHIIKPHTHLFDGEDGTLLRTETATASPIAGLMSAMSFSERLLSTVAALESLLNQINVLEESRTTTKLWFPTKLQHATAWVFGKSKATVVPGPFQLDDVDALSVDSDSDIQDAKEKFKPPQVTETKHRKRSGLGRIIVGTSSWLTNAEGAYALRITLGTFILALPAVIKTSAGFYYREKGLWALIMCQTGLVSYVADFSFAILSRVSGTVFGGIVGMVVWYIGAGGLGPGNPYGLSAAMAVVIVPIMWARLWSPPQLLQAVIITAATIYLVVGYSYSDTHYPSYGNPGVGYSVFWRRTLLVIVGFAVTAILLMLPRPPSAARHITKAMSRIVRTSADHYAIFLASWHEDPDHDIALLAESQAIGLSDRISALQDPVAMLRFEFSSSPYDSENLGQIMRLCDRINQTTALLIAHISASPRHMRKRFASMTRALDDRVIAEIMAVFSIIEQTLLTSDPMPAMWPTSLLGRCLESLRGEGRQLFTLEMLRSEEGRRCCGLLIDYMGLMSAMDELVMTVKEVVGEAHVVRGVTRDV